jgi:adenylate cyclase class 2
MIEAEIKAKLADAAATEKMLSELGFAKGSTVNEQDVYYNGNDRDFRKTDEALRIRAHKDMETGAQKNALTYKGPKLGSESQTRKELEISFEDPAEMRAILAALGYQQLLEVRKLRKTYRSGEITACVDHVDTLGDYLELEKLVNDEGDYPEAVGELYEWLPKLGISENALTRYSYLELLLKHNR